MGELPEPHHGGSLGDTSRADGSITQSESSSISGPETIAPHVEQPDLSPHRAAPLPVTIEDAPEEEKMDIGPSPLPTPPTSTEDVESPSTGIQRDGADASRGTLTPKPSPRQMHNRESHPEVHAPQVTPLPGAFKYLDADSPAISPSAIQRFADRDQRAPWSSGPPQHFSPSGWSQSSAPSNYQSDTFSPVTRENESYRSWSPDRHIPGGSPSSTRFPKPFAESQFVTLSGNQNWRSPDMPSSTPYTVASQPSFAGPPPPPLSPNENRQPLMSGYQLVAAKLSGTIGGPPVTPIYRRFEALNHRLLLYLQDELCELEARLREMDAADTQTRWFPGGIAPASRRKESLVPADQAYKKTEVLGQIGWKLAQYNKVLSSFRETQFLSAPAMNEIHDYRTWLAHGNYITEEETRFLDETSDLASLVIFEDEEPPKSAGLAPPTPNSVKAFLVQPEDGGSPKIIKSDNDIRQRRTQASKSTSARPPILLAYAVIVSVLVPILTFLVIPGFVERMVVVVLVFSGAVTAVVQSGLLKKLRDSQSIWDWALCGGVYGVLMTFVAATCS